MSDVLVRAARLVNRTIIEPFVRWRKRRAAIAALSDLDDAILEDIGISRCEIVGVIDGWIVRGDGTVRSPAAVEAPSAKTSARPATKTPAQGMRRAA